MKRIFVLLVISVLMSCSSKIKIVDKPIIFNEDREALTLNYLNDRYGLNQEVPTIVPKMVVLHWTAIPTLEKSFDAFHDPKLPNWRSDIENVSGLNVSAHFLVDRNGTIYRLLPETTMGRHVIGLNHCAIGIENVGGTKETPLTRAQLRSNIRLVTYLANTHDIEYVIGHHEYTLFEGHSLWLEKDAGYRTKKSDPGDEFMTKFRKAMKSFDFKPLPRKNM